MSETITTVDVCPVCGSGAADSVEAASCCLWRDLAPAARFRIAMAVERGADWQDAIVLETAP